jgi:hypothetical protein
VFTMVCESLPFHPPSAIGTGASTKTPTAHGKPLLPLIAFRAGVVVVVTCQNSCYEAAQSSSASRREVACPGSSSVLWSRTDMRVIVLAVLDRALTSIAFAVVSIHCCVLAMLVSTGLAGFVAAHAPGAGLAAVAALAWPLTRRAAAAPSIRVRERDRQPSAA